MGVFEWDNKYSVNLKEIDDQHMKLISLINHLYMRIEQNAYSDVEGVLKELADYTNTHFANEEKYMDKFNYSEADAHKKQHAVFTDKLAEMKKSSDSQSLLTIEITDFLLQWLLNHIENVDTKLAPFLKENGVN